MIIESWMVLGTGTVSVHSNCLEPGRRARGFARPSRSARPRGAGERRESQRHQAAPRSGNPEGVSSKMPGKAKYMELGTVQSDHWEVSIASFHRGIHGDTIENQTTSSNCTCALGCGVQCLRDLCCSIMFN